MDYTQSRTCYGPERQSQHATGVPLFRSLFEQLFQSDHITTRETFKTSIENVLNGIYHFLLAHQIDGQFVMPDFDAHIDPIIQNFGMEGHNRFSIVFFYLYQLMNSYMRCEFGTLNAQLIYRQSSQAQKNSLCGRALIDVWSGQNGDVSQENVVDGIFNLLEDKRDVWNPIGLFNQIPHNNGSRLNYYFKAVQYRQILYSKTARR